MQLPGSIQRHKTKKGMQLYNSVSSEVTVNERSLFCDKESCKRSGKP